MDPSAKSWLHLCLVVLKAADFVSCYSFNAGDDGFQPSCDYGDYQPDPDCTRFWRCANGKPFKFTCPAGLHFNPLVDVCDWPDSAGCSGTGGTGTKGSSSNSASSSHHSHGGVYTSYHSTYPYQPGTVAPTYYDDKYYTEALPVTNAPVYRPIPNYRPSSKTSTDTKDNTDSKHRPVYITNNNNYYYKDNAQQGNSGTSSHTNHMSGSGMSMTGQHSSSKGSGSVSTHNSGVGTGYKQYVPAKTNTHVSGQNSRPRANTRFIVVSDKNSGSFQTSNNQNKGSKGSGIVYEYVYSDYGNSNDYGDYYGDYSPGSGSSAMYTNQKGATGMRATSGRRSLYGTIMRPRRVVRRLNSGSFGNTMLGGGTVVKRVYRGAQNTFQGQGISGIKWPSNNNFGGQMIRTNLGKFGTFNGGNFGSSMGTMPGNTIGSTFGNAMGTMSGNSMAGNFHNTMGSTFGNSKGVNYAQSMGNIFGNSKGVNYANSMGSMSGNPMTSNNMGSILGTSKGVNYGNTMGSMTSNSMANTFGNLKGVNYGTSSGSVTSNIGNTMGGGMTGSGSGGLKFSQSFYKQPSPWAGQQQGPMINGQGPVGAIPVHMANDGATQGKPAFIGMKPFSKPLPFGGKPFLGPLPLGPPPLIGGPYFGGPPLIGPVGAVPLKPGFGGPTGMNGPPPMFFEKQSFKTIPIVNPVLLRKPTVSATNLGKAFLPVLKRNGASASYLQFNPLAGTNAVTLNDGSTIVVGGTGSNTGTMNLGTMNTGTIGMGTIGMGMNNGINMNNGMMMNNPVHLQKVLVPVNFVMTSTTTTATTTNTASTTTAAATAPVSIFLLNPFLPPGVPVAPPATIIPLPNALPAPAARDLLNGVLTDSRNTGLPRVFQQGANPYNLTQFATNPPSSRCTARPSPQRLILPLLQQSGTALTERKCSALGQLIKSFVYVYVENLPGESAGQCVIQVPDIMVTCNIGPRIRNRGVRK